MSAAYRLENLLISISAFQIILANSVFNAFGRDVDFYDLHLQKDSNSEWGWKVIKSGRLFADRSITLIH